jgi:hypothetical protein
MRPMLRPVTFVVLGVSFAVCGALACGAVTEIGEGAPGDGLGDDAGSDAMTALDTNPTPFTPDAVDYDSTYPADAIAYLDGHPYYGDDGYGYDAPFYDAYGYDAYDYDGNYGDDVVYPYDAPYARDVYPVDDSSYSTDAFYGFDGYDYDASFAVDTGPPWSGGAPAPVATSEQAVNLALDDNYFYWENQGGSVANCPLAGCTNNIPSLLSVNPGGYATSQSLGVGAGIAIFLDSDSGLFSCSGAGCDNDPSVYYGGSGDVDAGFSLDSLVADAVNVYFTDDASIYACPIGSKCSSPTTLTTSGNDTNLGPLYVTGGELYFVDVGPYTQSIRVVSTTGGGVRKICTSYLLSNVTSLVVGGGYVYFTTQYDEPSIYQCPVAGGGAPELYATDELPWGLATDDVNLYWTNNAADAHVVTCPIGVTCVGETTIATGQDYPNAIAVNATDVYWTTNTAIYRAAK